MTEPTDATVGCLDACGFAMISHALYRYDFNADDCLAYEAGCAAYVTKPFNPDLLLVSIRHQLALAGT